jgi:hypothetical protein
VLHRHSHGAHPLRWIQEAGLEHVVHHLVPKRSALWYRDYIAGVRSQQGAVPLRRPQQR